jgi:hypothetical protein
MFLFDDNYIKEWVIEWTNCKNGYPQPNCFVLARRQTDGSKDGNNKNRRYTYGIEVYGGKTIPEGYHIWTRNRFRTWDDWSYIPESANWLPGCPSSEGSYLIYHKIGNRNYLSLAIAKKSPGVVKIQRKVRHIEELDEVIAPVIKMFLYDCFFDRLSKQISPISCDEVVRHIRIVKG